MSKHMDILCARFIRSLERAHPGICVAKVLAASVMVDRFNATPRQPHAQTTPSADGRAHPTGGKK
jgi:hypothetical protein